MKPQKPAEGILLDKNLGSAVSYKLSCVCGSEDCTQTIWIEANEHGIQVNTYTLQRTEAFRQILDPHSDIKNNWLWTIRYKLCEIFNDICNKVRLTYQIWSQGSIDFHAELIMTKQQAMNYATVLKQAIAQTQRFQREKALDKSAE